MVEGFANGKIDKDSTGLLEIDRKFLHTKGLLVAEALACPRIVTVPIRIANLYEQSCTLNKHTAVATYEPLAPDELLTVNAMKTFSSNAHTPSHTEVPEHLENCILKVVSILLQISKYN